MLLNAYRCLCLLMYLSGHNAENDETSTNLILMKSVLLALSDSAQVTMSNGMSS